MACVLLQLSGFLIARWRRNQRGEREAAAADRDRERREQGASEDAAADRERKGCERERGGVSFDPFGLFG